MADQIKVLTVRQPWCWAIATQQKTVENRTWQTSYRGLLALHAGSRFDDGIFPDDLPVEQARQAYRDVIATYSPASKLVPECLHMDGRAVIAVAELAGIHHADDCTIPGSPVPSGCSPWAAAGQYHWELKDVQALDPVACHPGHLGLWTLPEDVSSAVRAQLETAHA